MGSKPGTRSQHLPPRRARQHEACLCWGYRDRPSFKEAREGVWVAWCRGQGDGDGPGRKGWEERCMVLRGQRRLEARGAHSAPAVSTLSQNLWTQLGKPCPDLGLATCLPLGIS